MQLTRRQFLQTGALAIAGTALLPLEAWASPKIRQLTGLQLYSVRDDMKADPLGTLKKLAAMGYKNVEHANYVNRKFYGYPALEFKKILGDLGMKMPSGHTVMAEKHWDIAKKDFTDEWKYTVEDAATMGQNFVISPWIDKSIWQSSERMKWFMDIFNKSGELCQKSGMKFGYHNHHFEFAEKIDGELIYDFMLKNTDPKLVMQQLDIGNLYNAEGANALDVIKKHPGRFLSLHVKDEVPSSDGHEKYESAILGVGIVKVKEVIDLAKKIGGAKHFIIEQESYQGKAPLECMQEDLAIMKKWGY
jgi:sugar phosphate isomerase/epimerase